MKIAIRADASPEIGAGHIMRCLTLADAFAQEGADITFLSNDLPKALGDLVIEKGHKAQPLYGDDCLPKLTDIQPDWLVVDHYGLDHRFESSMRPAVRKIMVIDDIADRAHDCDVLLDQNLGRKATDYRSLVPEHCRLLIGPHHALLRPDFARFREASLNRRTTGVVSHLLISLGGFDRDNITGNVLEALKVCELAADTRISVVMGRDAPWIDAVTAQAATLPWPIDVLIGVSDMARLMADSDLAIGAAGSSTWERCCVGLPTVMIILADNQRGIANAVSASYGLQPLEMNFSAADLQRGIGHFRVPEKYLATVVRSAELCDGRGVSTVIELMNAEFLS